MANLLRGDLDIQPFQILPITNRIVLLDSIQLDLMAPVLHSPLFKISLCLARHLAAIRHNVLEIRHVYSLEPGLGECKDSSTRILGQRVPSFVVLYMTLTTLPARVILIVGTPNWRSIRRSAECGEGRVAIGRRG